MADAAARCESRLLPSWSGNELSSTAGRGTAKGHRPYHVLSGESARSLIVRRCCPRDVVLTPYVTSGWIISRLPVLRHTGCNTMDRRNFLKLAAAASPLAAAACSSV